MTVFIFLASDENGDQGLVITRDHALFVNSPYRTKAIWFVEFLCELSTEPKYRKRFSSRDLPS